MNTTLFYPPCPKMPKGREITVTPVISTGHITKQDGDILDDQCSDIPCLYARHEYGWELKLGEFKSRYSRLEIKRLRSNGLSDDFVKLMLYFSDLGYNHLNIDRDGPVIEGLNQFEW